MTQRIIARDLVARQPAVSTKVLAEELRELLDEDDPSSVADSHV
jgi:hypothetical protein